MTGKIPKGWKKVKLGEITNITTGKLNSNAATPYGKYPFFTCAPSPLRINTYKFDLDAILLAGNNANGIFHIHRFCGKFNAYQRTYIITPKDTISLDYIFYALKLLLNYMKEISYGSATRFLTLKILSNLQFEIPESLDEQRVIASVLSSLDDKIDLLYRENKTLEQMAQTLFRKWFIEDAKEDWKEVPLKNIYVFEKGFEPGSKNYLEEKTENAIRFIRVGDMLNSNASIYIDKKIALRTCKEDDLMVSFDGTVGRVVFGIEGAYSSGIRKVCSDNPVYNNLGLKYLIFTSKDIQDLIKSYATGTVILHASSSINHLTFAFPEENDIKKINTIITPMFDKILRNKIQIRILEQLRDTLLPKLMSGEVKVKY